MAGAVSPARVCAFSVLRRVFEDGAWADRALQGEAKRLSLDSRDRALATQLAFGAVQRARTLDFVIERLAGRPVAKIEPAGVAALRLGLFQLLFLDRVPAHAAVGESVELAKQHSRGAGGLVNAVLRRAGREGAALVTSIEDPALRHSHPDWIHDLWRSMLGADEAAALMAADNDPPEPVLRANTLRITRDELAERLPVASRPAEGLPDALVLEAPFDAHGSELHEQGLYMPQSRAAQAIALTLDPQPGERVLDLCAAPGGKTTHLAALMRNEGEVVAVEAHSGRAAALGRTARRMGAEIIRVRHADATTIKNADAFDRVLVDPPCSDLGTLALRPDARWHKTPDDPPRLAQLQAQILRAGARALRPGGVLVYSTCTISPVENERLIGAFLDQRPDFTAEDPPSDLPVWDHPSVPEFRQTLPHRDRTDGFFFARLRRAS
jgi:16S rRNA (cytosine967-C5)-methyltransferase